MGFAQYATDMNGCKSFTDSGPSLDSAPSDAVQGMIDVDTDGELLLCLKQWCDTNFHLFVTDTTYRILTGEDILLGSGHEVCATPQFSLHSPCPCSATREHFFERA